MERHLGSPFSIFLKSWWELADLYSVNSESGRHKKIVIFFGANNLFQRTVPFAASREEVALERSQMAGTRILQRSQFYIIGSFNFATE